MTPPITLPEHIAIMRSGPDTAVVLNSKTGRASAFRCLGDDLNDILDVEIAYASKPLTRIFLIAGITQHDVKGFPETLRLCIAATEDNVQPALI